MMKYLISLKNKTIETICKEIKQISGINYNRLYFRYN